MELTLDQALQKGIEAHKAGQVQEADRLYTAILHDQPKHPDANHNMGVLAVGVGKVQEALPFFKTALEANPSTSQFWLSYIEALIKLGYLVDAKSVFDHAKNNGAKGDGFDKLEQKLDQPSKVQDPPQDQQQSVINLYSQGQLQQALEQASTLLQQFPKSSFLYNICGVVYKKLGQLDASIEAFNKAIAIKPDYAEAYCNMGNALQEQDKLEKAIGSYNKAIAIKPEYADPYNNMGNALQEQGKLEEALEAYNKAIAIKPEYADPYNNMGNALQEQGKLEEAIEAFNRALAIKPEYADAWSNIGNALKEQGKLEEAIEAFNRALAIKPEYADAWGNIGNALKEQGKLEEALEAFNKAIAIKPDHADVYNNMGVALQEQGKLEEAIEAFNKAIAIKPDHADVYNNMGVALQEQGKPEEAIEAYKKSISIKPDYADSYYNMGITFKEQGKLEEAIEAYNKALAIKPDNPDAYNNMGITLKDQGKLEEAIEAYGKSLSIKPHNAKATENSLSLQAQLQGTALTTSTFSNQATEGSTLDTKLRPKFNIINAISSFLSADRSQANRHVQNFNACDTKLLADLSFKDKVFCTAYSKYLSALLKEPFEKSPDFNTDNLIYHIGESHCLSYAHRNIEINGATFRITPMITFGAKAFHFSHANDNAFKAITKTNLTAIPKGSEVFISFGEIDCRPNEGFISAATKLDKPIEGLISCTVIGYLKWFAEQNRTWNHSMHFLNVPAPKFDSRYNAKVNAEVANVVVLFNAQIKKQIVLYEFNLIDVYRFTLGQDGFSNSQFHIDEKHLGAKAIPEIEQHK